MYSVMFRAMGLGAKLVKENTTIGGTPYVENMKAKQ